MGTAAAETAAEPTALVRTERPALRVLRPVAAPAEMIKSQNEAREFIEQVLEKDKDYGIIPGVKKPTLLKPGAEKVTLGFGCSAVPKIVEREIDHDRVVKWNKQKKVWSNAYKGDRSFTWDKEEGESLGLYRYVVLVEIVDQNGEVRGSGIGSCSSMESKYVDRPRDSENTILKMATKRAHVAAVLGTFGLSEQFTQDVEEMPREMVSKEAAAEAPAAPVSPLDKTWPNWPNFLYAKRPFREIPSEVLTEQLEKSKRTIERAKEKGDTKVVEMGERLVANIEAVLEIRRTETPATSTEPGSAKPAETPVAETPAATVEKELEQAVEDDDLPF